MQIKHVRELLRDLLGWPGVAIAAVASMAVALQLDSHRFEKVNGKSAIYALLADHTLKADGYAFFYQTDGRVIGQVGATYDVGEWEALDDVFCEKWNVYGNGTRRCWSVEIDGNQVRRTGSGFPFNENDLPVNLFERLAGKHVYNQH
ncbi:MAG: hypothetical protein AAF434_02390 [Pseudomonadota bacterium]